MSSQRRFFARICARAIFPTVTRIWTHNLSLARTPHHWATPSHVTNNEIFFFCHHFQISYITHFTAITVGAYNFHIYYFSIWGYNRSIRTRRRKKQKSFFSMPAVTGPIFPPCLAVWIVTFVHPTQLMMRNSVELSAFYSHVCIRSYHLHPGSLTRLYTDTQER